MQRLTLAAMLIAVITVASAADEVRYFLSFEGLTNPNDTDSAFEAPRTNDDPANKVYNNQRFYIWAQLLTPGSDLKVIDLAFRTEGSWTISEVNIWQNHFVPNIMKRWDASGVPGANSPSSPQQFFDVSAAFADTDAGITNGAFAAFDDQFSAGLQAAVIGYVEIVEYAKGGELHIIHQGSEFLNMNGTNRVYLGRDDFVGLAFDGSSAPYDNADPEAWDPVPEPSSIVLLAPLSLMLRRREVDE